MSFIETQTQNRWRHDDLDDLLEGKKPSCRSFICSSTIRGILVVGVLAICIPLLIYYFVIDKGTYPEKETSTCLVGKSYRVPCGPPNITSKDCVKIHCCYSLSAKQCFHYVPSKYFYYASDNRASQKMIPLNRMALPKMYMFVVEKDENRVSVILQNSSTAPAANEILGNKNYDVDKSTDQLAVEIYRKRGGGKENIIFSTAKGPLIASDGYWEWTFQLSNDKLFVFGEMFVNLENENSTLTKVIYKNKKDHTSVPMFIGYRNGKFTGLLVKHERPLEITIMPSKLVILRSLGESKIELELSVGPTPADVFDQQQKNYDLRIAPEWVIGVHLCREDEIVDVEDALYEYEHAQDNVTTVPHISDCFHQNLVMMIQKGRNISDLEAQVKKIKSSRRLLLSLPPHLWMNENNTLYQIAKKSGMLYTDPAMNNGTVYRGSYLDESVAYPDYSSPAAGKFIESLIEELSTKLNVTPDGLVLNDNWPLDDKFVMDDASCGEFPYLSKEIIEAMSSTIPWNATANGTMQHYLHHNQYGSEQLSLLENYYKYRNKTIFIMSASDSYSTHPAVVENVNISWANLKKSIKMAVSSSMFGNNYVSLPVCGSTKFFSNKKMEELCLRWYITAATMPLFRISSVFPRRFPQNMYTNFTINHMLDILDKRNQLGAHFYGLLRTKQPFLRPMFYDFYDDNNTLMLDEQYMIGRDILVAQPVLLDKTKLLVYLPQSVGVWYGLWDGAEYNVTKRKAWVEVDVAPTDWISFIAQGSIIPLVQVAENSTFLDVKIALNCTKKQCHAAGNLFVNGTILDFAANDTALTIDGLTPRAHSDMSCSEDRKYLLNKLFVYMHSPSKPKHPNIDLCKVNGSSLSVNYESNATMFHHISY